MAFWRAAPVEHMERALERAILASSQIRMTVNEEVLQIEQRL